MEELLRQKKMIEDKLEECKAKASMLIALVFQRKFQKEYDGILSKIKKLSRVSMIRGGTLMSRKMLMANRCSLDSNGVAVYLDEYGTREEAEKALYESVMENADYAIEEVEE